MGKRWKTLDYLIDTVTLALVTCTCTVDLHRCGACGYIKSLAVDQPDLVEGGSGLALCLLKVHKKHIWIDFILFALHRYCCYSICLSVVLQPCWASDRTGLSSSSTTASPSAAQRTPAAGPWRGTRPSTWIRNATGLGAFQASPCASSRWRTHQTLGCTGVKMSEGGAATPSASLWPVRQAACSLPETWAMGLSVFHRCRCDPGEPSSSSDGWRQRDTQLLLQDRNPTHSDLRLHRKLLQERRSPGVRSGREDDSHHSLQVWWRSLQVWAPWWRRIRGELADSERYTSDLRSSFFLSERCQVCEFKPQRRKRTEVLWSSFILAQCCQIE